jgi:hypothetical protein
MSSGAHCASSPFISRRRPVPSWSYRVGAMLAQTSWSTHAVSGRGRRCPVGAILRGGWKNRLGAGARSAFVSCSPCMAERSGLRARRELHGAGPEPVFPAKSEWSSFSCECRPSCTSPYRAPPAATRRRRPTTSPHPNPLPQEEGAIWAPPAAAGAANRQQVAPTHRQAPCTAAPGFATAATASARALVAR